MGYQIPGEETKADHQIENQSLGTFLKGVKREKRVKQQMMCRKDVLQGSVHKDRSLAVSISLTGLWVRSGDCGMWWAPIYMASRAHKTRTLMSKEWRSKGPTICLYGSETAAKPVRGTIATQPDRPTC